MAPWADFWAMQLRLYQAGPAEVDSFLARWGDAYVADRLRNDWLIEVGRRRDWATFVRVQPSFKMNDDREVTCLGVLARQQLGLPMEGSNDLRAQARKAWFDQKDADTGCDAMAQGLLAAGVLTQADVWRKLRLSLDGGQPKAVTQSARLLGDATAQAVNRLMGQAQRFLVSDSAVTPGGTPTTGTSVQAVLERHQGGKAALRTRKGRARVKALAPPPPPVPAEHIGPLNQLALLRWASQDPEAAAAALADAQAGPRWRLSREEQAWAWASIGRSAAWRLMPQTVSYYERALVLAEMSPPPAAWAPTWHPDTLAWMARAALRSAVSVQPAHWVVLDAAIDAMAADQKVDQAWVYWKARSLLAQAPAGPAGEPRRQQAREHLARIAGQPTFYGLLAAEDLHGQPARISRPAKASRDEQAQAQAIPGLDRALRLYALGLRGEAAREWNYTLSFARPGGLTDRELLAAAELACDREIWDRCINTSDRTRQEIDLYQRYPLPFRRDIIAAAREVNLDPAYMFGLIRQESRFQITARSVVGASGLMQVMPATADWVARRLGMSDYKNDLITDPNTNLKLGAGYLKLVLDDLGGSQPMAAAAYNAGPGRPRRWREGPRLEAAAWAENVPFNETRDYVKKVVTNATLYGHVMHGTPLSIKARLGAPIGPRAANAPPDNRDLP
ncbi:MAG: lytic transglycosylase domain-containing protein [Rubrivivax sp.]|nr:MAG: lytic transglycosylase domain-containing protein [Rubrivivax sp.]